MTILVIIGYILVIILDLVPLYKDKLWKDFWINTVISIISFTVAILLSLHIRVPSPAKGIEQVISYIIQK